MSIRLPRRPVERPQPPNGCLSCVVAQILYVYGLTELPDVGAVDRALGRKAGEVASESKAQLLLLRHGFHCLTFSLNDDDAFLSRGLDYLKEYFGREWSRQHEALYTPSKVREFQDRLREARRDRKQYARQIQTVSRWATRRDIRDMLTSNRVVDIPVRISRGPVQHAALLVPHKSSPDATLVWSYSPIDEDGRGEPVTVVRTRFQDAVSNLMPRRDVTAYWR